MEMDVKESSSTTDPPAIDLIMEVESVDNDENYDSDKYSDEGQEHCREQNGNASEKDGEDTSDDLETGTQEEKQEKEERNKRIAESVNLAEEFAKISTETKDKDDQKAEKTEKKEEQVVRKYKEYWGKRYTLEELRNTTNCVLLDIEGTTTSVNFVQDVIYKYIENIFPDYISEHWNEEELMSDVTDMIEQSKEDGKDCPGFVPIPERKSNPTPEEEAKFRNAFIANYNWQVKNNRKTRSIKKLQGHLVADGYKNKDLVGHVYEDVPVAFQFWKSNNIKICTFSNGSIYAQHHLFRHSSCGNLEDDITQYFDNTLGDKIDPLSYILICRTIKERPEKVLFFTDLPDEAFAAKRAGLKVILVQREPVSLTDDEKQRRRCYDGVISSFLDVIVEPAAVGKDS